MIVEYYTLLIQVVGSTGLTGHLVVEYNLNLRERSCAHLPIHILIFLVHFNNFK